MAMIEGVGIVVKSDSNPKVTYRISLGRDGVIYCTCPSWKFQKVAPKNRSACKHMKSVAKALSA